jgi:hypothetical protein
MRSSTADLGLWKYSPKMRDNPTCYGFNEFLMVDWTLEATYTVCPIIGIYDAGVHERGKQAEMRGRMGAEWGQLHEQLKPRFVSLKLFNWKGATNINV